MNEETTQTERKTEAFEDFYHDDALDMELVYEEDDLPCLPFCDI